MSSGNQPERAPERQPKQVSLLEYCGRVALNMVLEGSDFLIHRWRKSLDRRKTR